jgi:tol-pal system protein YbgF
MTVNGSTLVLLGAVGLAGCASSAQVRPEDASGAKSAEEPGVIRGLQRETEDQARRIAELEARLSLLEQESRNWRGSGAVTAKPAETIRIGERRRTEDDEEPRQSRAKVAVVQLHERGRSELPEVEAQRSDDGPLLLPEPPLGVAAKLGVVPLPHERATRLLDGPPRSEADGPAARERYLDALRALRERRWNEARDGFTRFLRVHPDHDLAANATYWRGEAYYAERRYAEALVDFQWAVSRFAEGEKAADALLKIGMCQKHLGDRAAAERSFRQLREQYPSSDAARIASRENPS